LCTTGRVQSDDTAQNGDFFEKNCDEWEAQTQAIIESGENERKSQLF